MITLPPFGRIHCRIIHTSSVANHLDDVWSKKWMEAKLDELGQASSCNSSRDSTKVSPGNLPRRAQASTVRDISGLGTYISLV